ncbi:PTS mannitol transporter subunit IICB [Cryobacterium cheniae]|uniref:PTS system mannitol-specific EIICB component n=1 Tax=Cryobacterium cheniae TaxID=1259262 RepID=A0A4R8XV23_9MICO|nr:PTS mannitol transporter subunit IICB [Cryobacterium cheniae]TFC82274.1 PTS mannitol transporter subunit IICB [Cryobacterium cheniae]
MTTSSANKTKSGGTRVHVQRFGTFLSGMVMPNIPAFIAWGLITAFFIPTGWTPNATLETLVGPMIVYLLPLLIANTGGRMVYGTRGAVVASIATMGVIVGSEIPMFIGAMIVGPGSAYLLKKLDTLWAGKIKPGFEMLVDNFASGILGMILALGAFFGIAPLVTGISNFLEMIVDWLVVNSLLPIASIFIEPGKILFLNNAINHGVLTPIGVQQVAESGQSVLFLLEANPGPGLGILLAFSFFGVGIARASAPGAIIIHFFGGIHEIYFPYVLMKPALLLAVIGGGMTGVAINVAFATGLRAPASPGSIIAILIQTAPGSYVGVILSVIGAATVSFLIAAVILRSSRKRDLAAGDTGDMAEAIAKTEANKGKASTILAGLAATDASSTTARPVKKIIFACDAGMGSSAMGASVLRNKIKKAGVEGVTVTNQAIANLDGTADLVITHQDLTARAQSQSPNSVHISVENFMNSPKYEEVVALLQSQTAEGVAR